VVGEDALDGFGVVGGDGGPNPVAVIDYQSDGLLSTGGIEVPPVDEVTAAPYPPSADLAGSGQGEFVDTFDRTIRNSLGPLRVVAADDQPFLVTGDPAVVVVHLETFSRATTTSSTHARKSTPLTHPVNTSATISVSRRGGLPARAPDVLTMHAVSSADEGRSYGGSEGMRLSSSINRCGRTRTSVISVKISGWAVLVGSGGRA
jgi:hypothetical protein